MSKKHQQPKPETSPTATPDAKAPGAAEALTPESMGSEARIQRLESDIRLIEHVARHGTIPAGASSDNPTVETVRILAGVALTRREDIAALQDSLKRETARADAAEREAKEWATLAGEVKQTDEAAKQSAAFRADLVALDELARGTNPNLPITTEHGQHLLKSIQELLRVIDVLREQALEDAPPESGWSSPRAKELVEAVAPNERPLLLGDLLALLAPHVGETGANETAADVLRRKMKDLSDTTWALGAERNGGALLLKEYEATLAKAETLQAAMVARRSAIAEAHAEAQSIAATLSANGFPPVTDTTEVMAQFHAVMKEWNGLRAMLSQQPMVAVVVRDDSTPSLAERYALGVLEWDGKRLNFEMLEGPARPWSELVRLMKHTVDTRLVPPTFR